MKTLFLILAAACTACSSHHGAVEADLDALIVSGTAGGARAREVGSSVGAVNISNIENRQDTNIESALRGRVSGLSVLGNSGQPGAAAAMRLRGNHSVVQESRPLIYIDGVRVYGGFGPTTGGSMQAFSPLNDIAPSQIERIEILKGPAATTLYGTEGANGVIQIFTRRGSVVGAETSGKPRHSAAAITP